jgi:hypothetical protein
MKLCWLIKLSVVVISITATALAQQRPVQKKATDVRISKEHPTVYISFVRVGTAEPLYASESNERVWLKFHNNTRWKLRLRLDGSVSKEYGHEIAYAVKTISENRDVVISEPVSLPLFIPPGIDLPKRETTDAQKNNKEADCEKLDFFSGGDVFTTIELQPGRSLTFTVPREYLCKKNYICVNFEYEWERRSDEPEHTVCFYGYSIPKS